MNLYVMPITTTIVKGDPFRSPKYRSTFETFVWSMYDYGDEPFCLVSIVDIDAPTDTALTANNDVFKLPSNLDTTMGSVQIRNGVRSNLQANEFPGSWVQTTTTWRSVVTTVGACCQFAQRYQGLIGGLWFAGSVHVTSTFQTLTTTQQNGITATAQSFGFSTAVIAPTTAIDTILKNLADQYTSANLPLDMAGGSLYTG